MACSILPANDRGHQGRSVGIRCRSGGNGGMVCRKDAQDTAKSARMRKWCAARDVRGVDVVDQGVELADPVPVDRYRSECAVPAFSAQCHHRHGAAGAVSPPAWTGERVHRDCLRRPVAFSAPAADAPATGIMMYGSEIAADAAAILVSLTVSFILVVPLTGHLMQYLIKRQARREEA